MSNPKAADKTPKPLPDIGTHEGRREILRRVADGDKASSALVGKVFDLDQRDKAIFTTYFGDAFAHTSKSVLNLFCGNDTVFQEGMRRKLNSLRDELAGPNPTPLERILCERVALCWLDAHAMDRLFSPVSEVSFKTAAYREDRRERTHRRFLSACKTLATVRRLPSPAVQINQVVARQQVNVGNST